VSSQDSGSKNTQTFGMINLIILKNIFQKKRGDKMNTLSLEVTKKISAPAAMTYDTWLDPNAIREFMRPGDVITIPHPKIEAKVGGAFLLEIHLGKKNLPHKGEYKVLDRINKIQFTWNSMNTNNEDSKSDHNGVWANILKNLGLLASK
jgi:uncharacterized protein YndB with AHSA1/START domain